MKNINEETKQSSSINNKIRQAGFVNYKNSIVGSFKYNGIHNIINKVKLKLQNLKRLLNSIIGKPRLWLSVIDWKKVFEDLPPWFLEVLIEGSVANWWTYKILGLDFGVGMIVAHGFLIKQSLDYYRRLKNNGSNSKLPTKDK